MDSGINLTIVYASSTGTSKNLAHQLRDQLVIPTLIKNASEYEGELLENEKYILFIISTWIEGACPESASNLFAWIDDTLHDFRYGNMFLSKVRFSVFGVGGKIYGENYCRAVSMSLACLY